MVSEAQKRASRKYDKANTKLFNLRFGPNDEELWDYLQKQENKSGFVKELIREHMKENSE